MSGALPPLATILPPNDAPLDVIFDVPSWGWCSLHVPQLSSRWTIRCTEVDDPFPELIVWLERIAHRRSAATWQVAEEGSTSHFIFLGAKGFVGGDVSQLIYSWTAAGEVRTLTARAIGRRAVIAAFYNAFRHMTASPDYDPKHREGLPDGVDRDDLPDAEYDKSMETNPFSGALLRDLKSVRINEFLASEPHEDEDESIDTNWVTIRS